MPIADQGAGNVTVCVEEVIARASQLSQQQQEQLILQHMQIVRYIALKIHRTLPAQVDLEELMAAGMLGLVDAAARFRPESGAQFASFAQFRVRGAILDSLRDLDWAPRELRRKAREIEGAMARITQRTGRSAEEVEVAAELGLALCDLQTLLGELDGLNIGSLNIERGEESGEEEIAYVPGRPTDDPLFQCLEGEMREIVAGAISDLPERERTVIALYYYEELTMREIGQVLGVAESRISQMRASAVLKLRVAIAHAPEQKKSARRAA